MRLEAAKGFIPALLVALFHIFVQPVPLFLMMLLIGGALAWVIFVLTQATAAALCLNRRHHAYLAAAGVDTNPRSILEDRDMWRKATAGMTMREFIAARRGASPRV